jgi:hypothetical protein
MIVVRGQHEPVIRSVVLGATKCSGARGHDASQPPRPGRIPAEYEIGEQTAVFRK